MKNQSH